MIVIEYVILLLIFYSFYSVTVDFVGCSPILKAARNPVILSIKPYIIQNNHTTHSKNYKQSTEIKSGPEFFQSVLGIRSDSNFTLNLDNWRELQQCGLYSNLTAKTFMKDDQVYLEISGNELPSTDFAPEVSVKDISDGPDFSGGISFRDRNFLGFGNRVDAIITKKEGSKVNKELPVSLILKWTDRTIGKSSKLSLGINEDHNCENINSLKLYGDTKDEESRNYLQKIHLCIQKLYFNVIWTPKSFQKRFNFELEPYVITLNPLETLLGANHHLANDSFDHLIRLSGARTSLRYLSPYEFLVNAWIDSGITKLKSKKSLGSYEDSMKYCQHGMDIVSPLYLFGKFPRPSFPRMQTASNISDTAEENSFVDVFGKCQYKFMSSRGDGCLPLFHGIKISDAHLLRGIPSIVGNQVVDSRDDYPRHPFYQVLKVDLFAVGSSRFLSPGVFADFGKYFEESKTKTKTASSIGLSLRSQGFRVDLAWPVSGGKARLYLGLDS